MIMFMRISTGSSGQNNTCLFVIKQNIHDMQIWWITVSAKGRLCFWQRIIDHLFGRIFDHIKMEILTISSVEMITI